jgi:hypothetical protein
MKREEYAALSGADYVRAMYKNTKKDGALCLKSEGEKPVTWYMDWNEADAEAIANRVENLAASLRQLAKERGYWEKSTKDMPAQLLEVWNTYIAPFPGHGLDDDELEEIWWKEEYGELTQEEQEILRQYNAWYEENALQRLPYLRRSPVWVMNRALRFVRLVSLRAPEIVIANEERFLAEEMALYCGVVDFG